MLYNTIISRWIVEPACNKTIKHDHCIGLQTKLFNT